MDWVAYRKEVEAQLAEAKEDLEHWESGKMYAAKRSAGETSWTDITAGQIVTTKRIIAMYEKILADLTDRGY